MTANEISGTCDASGRSFGIVVSRFNTPVTSALLQCCVETLCEHGAAEKDMRIVWVPGAFEIPLIAQRLAAAQKWDAVICLGAVIRGETPHFDYICNETSRAIMEISLAYDCPVIFGLLTTDTVEQAKSRAAGDKKNKGREFALAAMEMASLETNPET